MLRDGFLARAKALSPSSAADRLTLDIFMWNLQTDAGSDVCRFELWTLGPTNNPAATILQLQETHAIVTPEDADHFLARLDAFPAYVEASILALREGVHQGRVTDVRTAKLTVESLDRVLAQPVEQWALLDAAKTDHPFPVDLFRKQLHDKADGPVRAAIARYRDVVRDEIVPNARPEEKAGVWAVPDGKQCYTSQIAKHTTIATTADAVHATGLAELDRIHAEMKVLGKKVLGTDDLPTIFARLRDDPALRFDSADAIVAKATKQLDRARQAIPRFFGRLPKAPCNVRIIPDNEAPYTYVAYYSQPHTDGTKPGEYYVNTYAPTTRLRHEAAVLAAHESIPGHHLQIAIAQELPAIPTFRRNLELTAYIEGWALYSERLGEEMGLYDDDLDRLGVLSYDSWRASRLVVDTGLHDEGWTREQSVQFFLDNTPLAENNIRNEVDRYVSWPGQALGYKIGQLEILRLRHDAETRLGPKFDIKAFHDVILDGGAMPLPMLDARVEAWIQAGGA
jgi:uncharacterized protein (DUF885 family)